MGVKTGNPTWEDFPSTATLVTAARLNAIESGIDNAIPTVRHSVGGAYSYTGSAARGALEGGAVWNITRIHLVTPPVVTQATGSWTGRAGLSYS